MPTPNVANTRLARIAQARRTLLQDRAPLPAGSLAPCIERSWQRCLGLGLQADAALEFQQWSGAQMRRTLEANRQLVQSAKPILENLGRAIVNTRYFAILTNRDGVVVDVSGAIDHSDPRAHLISRIGTDLSERSIGTTAIGMALTELQPVWLHRGEHFFTSTSIYSCAGAPLFGPDGACVGMLDLTGIEALERPEFKHLVTQSANRIENALLLAHPHSLLLRLNWPGNALGTEANGLFCLDSDGCLAGSNQIARQMVPELAACGPEPVHVSALLGVALELLFDQAGRSPAAVEIPLWSGLRLQVQVTTRAHQTPAMPIDPPAARALPLRDVQAALIRQAVNNARGNVLQAARALGISRATVYRKLGQKPPAA